MWVSASSTGCGSDDDKKCDPVANSGCDDGQVCEQVMGGGDPVCAAPVVLRGKVFALATSAAIIGARVVALDVNGSPASAVASSVAAAGSYELVVPALRNADGTPVAADVTLRADAAGFQTFPFGIRQSLPIKLSTAVAMDGKLVIATALTDLGLITLPSAPTGSIAGKVAVAPSRAGVLVVAEPATGPGATAVADIGGDYKIFNVGAGPWTVKAYAKGVSYKPVMATVTAGQTAAVNLELATDAVARVSGKIELADPGSGSKTSVILVVESTFTDTLGRGETPPGLRVGDISNTFAIEGVPAGKYVVLAAFENDNLVRDPDVGIGGTTTLHREVIAGQNLDIAESFKVTGALDVIGPGKDGPESVTTAPGLTWVDDSSEEKYRVVAFDALGTMVMDKTVDRETGKNPVVPYEGPLQKGMYYQFRAYSLRTKGMAGLRPISATEDLRGVFFVPPAAP